MLIDFGLRKSAMIASEQELLLVEQHAVPPCMPRRGDGQKVRAERHGLGSFKHDFGIRLGGKFGAVDDALGREHVHLSYHSPPSLLQVGSVKALGEPAIDRCQQLAGCGTLALALPLPSIKSGQA